MFSMPWPYSLHARRDVDRVTFGERHDRFLVVFTLAEPVAETLQLAHDAHRIDRRHLDLEQRFALFSDMIKEGLAIPVDPENTVELSGAMVKAITVPAPKKMISRVDTYINQNSMEVAALIHQRLYKSVTT